MNDHRISGRDINPRFNDRCGKQNIVFAIVKRIHAIIEITCRHLAMRHHETDLWHMITQEGFNLRQIFNARHNIKRLTTAIMFAQQRLADGGRVKFADIRPNGQPINWRRSNQAKVTHTRKRHLQCARNGRGR